MQNLLTVSELNSEIHFHLNDQFSNLFVLGEIAELTFARSGHVYFTLKDAHAQISGVIWKSNWLRLQHQKIILEEGQQFICGGDITVYQVRGTYQLNVRFLQPYGAGPLDVAFRKLKEKLTGEGLFDSSKKQSLPRFPNRVAVVTSPTGAAIQDFLQTIKNRWPNIYICIFPVTVQGTNAANQIASAIDSANRIAESFDTLVVIRGGGSLEDLWAFNEEVVCRSIANSKTPVLTGIGHETDQTLADLAADKQALTPTDAAVLLVPDQAELIRELQDQQNRMVRSIQQRFQNAKQSYLSLADRTVFTRPLERIQYLSMEVDNRESELHQLIRRSIEKNANQLLELNGRLQTLNPLAVLERGYSLTSTSDGRLITEITENLIGQPINIKMASGSLLSRVEKIQKDG